MDRLKTRAALGEIVWALVPAFGSVLVCFLLYALNHRYFYLDDRLGMFVPVYLDIGRMLHEGVFPWMTLGVQASGNYLVEYQFGIFNPLCLFAMWLAPLFDNQAFAHAVISAVYVAATSLACSMLGRALRFAPPFNALIAFVVATNAPHMIWNVTAWLPAAPGLCFFILALAAALSYVQRPGTRAAVGVTLSAYLLLTAGWPQSVAFFVVLFALLVGVVLYRERLSRESWKRVTGLSLLTLAGFCLAALAVIALIAAAPFTERPQSMVLNAGNFMAATVGGLFMAAFPFFGEFFFTWGGYKPQTLPHFYAAWFLLPAVVFVDWSKVRFTTAGRFLAFATLLAGLLALGPERLGPLRFPIRFVPYYHVLLIFFLGWVVQTHQAALCVTRHRLLAVLGLSGVMAVMAWETTPYLAGPVLASSLLTGGLSALLGYALLKQNRKAVTAVLAGGTLLALAAVFAPPPFGLYAQPRPYKSDAEGTDHPYPFARGVDWLTPEKRSGFPDLGRAPNRYTLFFGHYVPALPYPEAHYAFRPASLGLLTNMRSVNGYTSLGHAGYRQWLRMDHGNLVKYRAEAAKKIFERDPETGARIADLLGIDQIIALKGEMSDLITANKPVDWVIAKKNDITTTYHAPPAAEPLPGTVSWLTKGVTIKGLSESPTEERMAITTPDAGGKIIFARIWWPGFHADLDGRELPVTAHGKVLVSVTLPAQAKGVLRLTYRAPGHRIYPFLAGLALFLFIPAGLFLARRTKALHV